MKNFIKESFVIGMYFSPAILASVLFMVLEFGNFVCMLVFAVVMCLTIWATKDLSRS